MLRDEAELILYGILKKLSGKFPDDTEENVLVLLDHNEPAVALEILVTQMDEYEIPMSSSDREILRKVAGIFQAEVDL